MAEGFDDFNIDRPGGYNLDQYNDYYKQTLEDKSELFGEHGDNLGTPKSVRVKYKEYDRRLKVIDEERNKLIVRESKDRREKNKSRKGRREESETSWIDDNIDYKRADLYVLRVDGKKDNLLEFINDYVDIF